MMRYEIFTFGPFINRWGELLVIGMSNLDHKNWSIAPQFWRARTATDSLLTYALTFLQSRKGQNPLHQFPRSKFVTSWRGQKSVVRRDVSQIPLQRLVGNFPVYGETYNGCHALTFV